jgi:hypothetical protein
MDAAASGGRPNRAEVQRIEGRLGGENRGEQCDEER